jgi:LPXTG-site transpeptidase (sortase) family protein
MLRLFAIFAATFVVAFLVLNMRFVEKNIQYIVAPGTIRSADSIGDAVRLLPLSGAVEDAPLPQSARLVIDALGISAPIVFGTPDDTDAVYDQLENGVVHYSTSAKPGNPGTAIILGHSSAYPWYNGDYGAVFALLSRLKPGDRFYIQYSDNRTFVFEMKESVVFNPFTDTERLGMLENRPGSNVILLSCYPVGTNYKRIAVLAERVQL